MAQSQVALSWDTRRALLCTTDTAAVTLLASQKMSGSADQAETRECLLKGFIGPRRRFNIAALTKHAPTQPAVLPHAKRPKTQHDKDTNTMVHTPLPLMETGSSRRWVMIKHKGAPRVHLLPDDSDVPSCRRRRGQVGTPIVRMASIGVGIHEIRQMG